MRDDMRARDAGVFSLNVIQLALVPDVVVVTDKWGRAVSHGERFAFLSTRNARVSHPFLQHAVVVERTEVPMPVSLNLPERSEPRWLRRSFWAATLSGSLGVLVLARLLTPHRSGLGTHMQLGIPPCAFLKLTTFPCPSCGLTTAFAHMARFDFVAAEHSHALAGPLFALTVIACVISLPACVRAWPIADTLRGLRVTRLAVIIGAAAMLAWVVRVAAMIIV
jgi:hypothetical protein